MRHVPIVVLASTVEDMMSRERSVCCLYRERSLIPFAEAFTERYTSESDGALVREGRLLVFPAETG